MDFLTEKFSKLGVDNAPGQESLQKAVPLDLRGEKLSGRPVDFSHGDVDAFEPIPGSLSCFEEGYAVGGKQAYTPYRGGAATLQDVAEKLSAFTGAPVDPKSELILTPGTQGALFLAMGSLIGRGDKVAIVEPDYFANRKLVEFFDGELTPVSLDYMHAENKAGLDLQALEKAFQDGAKLFLFSNPNNPTGVIYSEEEVRAIASLAARYGAALIVDELYSRQLFDARPYTHLRALEDRPENVITIIGPSKTESMSGFRLGAAFGSSAVITRMEKLQAIVSLRAAGYCQAEYALWFNEPEGWMQERVAAHQAIRDELFGLFQTAGMEARLPEGGSYLFVKIPRLSVPIGDFVKILRAHADVTVTPGTEFGPFKDCFRINFSQDRQAAREAVLRLIEMAKRYQE